MVVPNDAIGITILVAGAILFLVEMVHPGALLLIPGSILLVAGGLYLLLPDVLLNSLVGPFIVLLAAVISTVAEIPLYKWMAPVHRPLSTTTSGLVGELAVVTVPVVPNSIRGKVRVKSEIWSAKASVEIPVGAFVRVIRGEGVSLTVEPVEGKGTL